MPALEVRRPKKQAMSIAAATTLNPAPLDRPAVDPICFLSVGSVQKANSGHPGLPLGAVLLMVNAIEPFGDHPNGATL
jgi:hypothetical protein